MPAKGSGQHGRKTLAALQKCPCGPCEAYRERQRGLVAKRCREVRASLSDEALEAKRTRAREAMRANRAKNKALGRSDVSPGAALRKKEAQRANAYRRNQQTLERATRKGSAWTPEEDRIVMSELTLRELSIMLGRTYQACSMRRAILRRNTN